eukprot:6929664-Prymnesium_polylepis.1
MLPQRSISSCLGLPRALRRRPACAARRRLVKDIRSASAGSSPRRLSGQRRWLVAERHRDLLNGTATILTAFGYGSGSTPGFFNMALSLNPSAENASWQAN